MGVFRGSFPGLNPQNESVPVVKTYAQNQWKTHDIPTPKVFLAMLLQSVYYSTSSGYI